MAVDVGSAVGYLDLDISGFISGLQSAQSQANTASKNIATKIGSNLQSAGKSMTSAGSTLTKTVTTPVLGLGTAAVKVTSNFESAMSKVSAISGATGGDLDALNKKAQEMGAKTKFSATESAEAFQYMAMAGWKTGDMLDGIEGIMSLAAADGLDLAKTSDIVTDSLTAFGLSAKDSGHFSDVLAKASSSANTNVSMLGESFKYVAPVAGSLGYSAEDTAIALGLMANAGIKGSQAGTALRTMMTNMIKPTDAAANAMQEYGLSMTNSDGTMKTYGQVMDMLREKLGGLDEATQAQVATTIFGKEAMSGALAIINASDKDYQNLTKAIYSADGAANQMAQTMLNNLSGQITLLKSALEGLAIQFGEILMPYIKKFVGWLQSLVQKLQEMTAEQKDQIVKWAAFAAAIGPVLMIFGKLTSSVGSIITTFGKIPGAIKIVTGGFTKLATAGKNVFEGFKLARAGFPGFAAQASKLGAAIGGISAPVVAVVAVIAVLVAALVHLWKTNEDFRKKITSIWNGITSKFKEAGKKITDAINSLGFNFTGIVDVLKSAWEGFCNFIAPVFEAVFGTIGNIIGGIVDVVTGIIQTICGIIKGFKDGDWTLFLDGIKTLFTGAINLLLAPFKAVFEAFKGPLTAFAEWWSGVWSGIKEFFSNIWLGISSFFSTVVGGIQSIAMTVFGAIASFFKTVWNGIKTTVMTVVNGIKSFLSGAWNAIKAIITTVVGAIKTVILRVFNAIKSSITTIVKAIKTVITTVWNAIKNVVTTVVNGIKNTITTVWNGIKNVVTTVMNAIKGTFSKVWNAIKTTIGTVVEKIKSLISTGLDSAKSAVSSILGGIKNAFTKTFNGVKSFMSGIVSWLKGIFKFKWSLPKIKLPHFKISGSFSLNPPKVPSFGVDWYSKAMSNGMVLNSPTIFGYDMSTGKFLGGGEVGSETVVGTQNLMSMIASTVSSTVSKVMAAMSSSLGDNNGDIVIPVYIGNEMLDTLVVKATDRNNYRSGGR